jgi:hypothetical protein
MSETVEHLVDSRLAGETCPSATMSTTNPTLPDPGSNPGRHGGKPATNRLSYGAAFTSTVTPRIAGNDEKESLKSERVKYGRESEGTRTRE